MKPIVTSAFAIVCVVLGHAFAPTVAHAQSCEEGSSEVCVPELPNAAVPEPPREPTPKSSNAWLFLQLRQFGALGINRGALYTSEFDFGFGLPLGTPHLSWVLGGSVSLGSTRDAATRQHSLYAGMGVFTDLRLRFNVQGPVRMFAVTGARLNLGGPVHSGSEEPSFSASGEEECPSQSSVEASFGLGAEVLFGRQGMFSLSVRGVRRRAIAGLPFAANGMNPPVDSTRAMWGVVGSIEVGVFFD